MSRKRIRLNSFHRGDIEYKIKDCVLVKGEASVPYIGQIREIQQGTNKNDIQVQVAWFYRPEEALGGRKQFHGERELFKSDHLDWCHSSTIEGRCKVHSLKLYQALKDVQDTDYFARFTYKPATHEFRPDRVPVYCTCEMPYNPDLFMVMCEQCEEWYHPKCLGVSDSEAEKWEHFVCSSCKSEPPGKQARHD